MCGDGGVGLRRGVCAVWDPPACVGEACVEYIEEFTRRDGE